MVVPPWEVLGAPQLTVDPAQPGAVRSASMKKRAPVKKKSAAAKPRAAKKSSAKVKKPAARAAAAPTPRAQAYTPAPIKTDGWAPFRYPLQ